MYIIKAGVLYNVANGVEKEFTSPFAEEFYADESRSYANASWKHGKDDDESANTIVPRSMLWGGRGKGRPPAQVLFDCVFETPDRLYYVLKMSTSRGLFYYDFRTGHETRLFHRTEFDPHGLFVDDNGDIFTTISNSDGTVHLVKHDLNGIQKEVLTSGDCRDENPCRHGTFLYYQSSGLARNAGGEVVAQGPSAINRLDVKSRDIEPVIESDKFDYLLPRVTADGTVYCIQTPYRAFAVYSLKQRIIDILLFPWRLCVAIFAYLNVFSLMFTKKPLTTAGGPNRKDIDMSGRIVHNRLVNAQETWRREGKRVAVPKEWKLIRLTEGTPTEIAGNVVWFDLDAEGQPVYTDGYSLFDTSGKRCFNSDEMVSCLSVRRDGAPA
ncbi:MAG: hypothetical protein ACLQVD_21015 [Capsulimonadaceae bacterium]